MKRTTLLLIAQLVFGSSRAQPPQYEMTRLVDADALDGATVARLGAAQQNAGYTDPAPWTERHPIVLWCALGIALAVLGFIAVRTMQTGQ